MGKKKRDWSSLIFHLSVAGIYTFLLLPIVIVLLASVSPTSYLTFPPKGFTLAWYAKAMTQSQYVDGFKFSLVLAAATVVISSAIGVMASLALMRFNFPGKELINAFVMSPLIFPMVIIGIALLQFFSLLRLSGSFAGLLVGHVIITFPYMIRTISASLHRFDVSLEEAAWTLGANRWRAFLHVTFPLIRPGIVAGAVFAFIVSFDNVPVSIFLQGVTQSTLPVVIFSYIEYGVDPTIAAISTMLIGLTGAAMYFIERWVGISRIV
ncbi:MAG: ABC transporter permease [Thermodesulfobacteriota bacterium]